MGAKTWMLVYADGDPSVALKGKPLLDRASSHRLATVLFPGEKLLDVGSGSLAYTDPSSNEIYVGSFPGVSIVAASEFGLDRPSSLPRHFLDARPARHVYLHAMHSVVDWFAYAYWSDGKLVRALSLSPDSGVLEDTGARLPFEEAYWSGQHPALDPDEDSGDYPFPFHPLELGEAALGALFGYQLEGPVDRALLEPEAIELLRLQRARSKWKFWRS